MGSLGFFTVFTLQCPCSLLLGVITKSLIHPYNRHAIIYSLFFFYRIIPHTIQPSFIIFEIFINMSILRLLIVSLLKFISFTVSNKWIIKAYSRICSNIYCAVTASTVLLTISPIEAASGVATLSGFTLNL